MEKPLNEWGYESTKWGYRYIMQIPEEWAGVYIIWCHSTKVCVYVGQAKEQSIRARLLQHQRHSHNEKLNQWIRAFSKYLHVCYKQCNGAQIDALERRLIRVWKPEANKQWNPNEIHVRK